MPEDDEASPSLDVDDLASLPELNDASVVAAIRHRFSINKIYTQINNLLIAMNPYQVLPIYTAEKMAEYKAAAIGSVPPHVFGTSAAAYSGLLALRSQVRPFRTPWKMSNTSAAPLTIRDPNARSPLSSPANPVRASPRPPRRCCNSSRLRPHAPAQMRLRASSHAFLRRAPSSRHSATPRRR